MCLSCILFGVMNLNDSEDKEDGSLDLGTQSELEAMPPEKQVLKLVLEMGPLAAFFFGNWYGGIFWGTGCFMAATVVSLAVSRVVFGKVPIMPLVTGVFVLVFGAMTLLLHNELFIKVKPTVVNLLFASILFGGLFFGHSLLKYVLGEVIKLTDEGWRILTVRWACFFLFLALLNEIVWRTTSTDFWVSFKVFGLVPLSMIFAVAQIGVIKKYEKT